MKRASDPRLTTEAEEIEKMYRPSGEFTSGASASAVAVPVDVEAQGDAAGGPAEVMLEAAPSA